MSTERPAREARLDHPLSEEICWRAIVNREATLSRPFVFAVTTTGIYCRSDCPARRPSRKNVRFYPTPQDAEMAGFRPCLRCLPQREPLEERRAALITQACRIIEASERPPSLTELAQQVSLSPSHFHRLFKAQTGLTPKAYAMAHRSQRIRATLPEATTVTQAIYAAGFSSSDRFYERAAETLAMPPEMFRQGGHGATIRFAVGQCWLGAILVAASERGLCAVFIGDDPEALVHDLERLFARANLMGNDEQFEHVVARVIGFVNDPNVGLNLPLDIRGTAFQQRVWSALRQIPAGTTTTYAEIAARINQPNAVRAVAGACAANLLAVAIPCHRVVRTDGSPSGYRWGIERKQELLRREQETT